MSKTTLLLLLTTGLLCFGTCLFAQPANNDCANAIAVQLSDAIEFTTIDATTDGVDHPEACLPSGGAFPQRIFNDVWFTWTASLTGTIEFSTCNMADFDTKIAVYGPDVECPGSDANIIACNEDGPGCANFESVLTFDAEEGRTYLLRIGGWGNDEVGESGTGTFSLLEVEAEGTPENNTCQTATAIEVSDAIEFSTVGATTDGPEHPTACLPSGGSTPEVIYNDVFFAWTATFTGTAEFSTCGTADFDSKIAVYGPNASCPLTDADVIACSEDAGGCANFTSRLVFEVMEGETFILRIGGWGSGAPGESGAGTFSLLDATVEADPPANDDCSNAIVVELSDAIEFTTIAATTDGPDHPTACLPSGGNTPEKIFNDVWYRFTSPTTAPIEFSTCGTADFDTKIAVYGPDVECPGSDANIIACSEDGANCANFTSNLIFDAEAGRTYLLRIGGWGSGAPGESGIGTFSLAEFDNSGAPVNDECDGAIALDLGIADSTFVEFVTTGARTSEPEHDPLSCFDIGERFVHNDIWYTWEATFTGFLEWSNCGTSTFDSRMAVYLASEEECMVAPDSLIGCSDDGLDENDFNCGNFTSRAVFPVVEGRVYKFRIGGWSPSDAGTGTFTVRKFSPPPPPANDNCANAERITITTAEQADDFEGVIEGSNRSASFESVNPSCRQSGEFLDVWYAFNSGNNTEVEVRFIPESQNTDFIIDLFAACGVLSDSVGVNYCFRTDEVENVNSFVDTIQGLPGEPTEWLLRISTRITSDAPGEFFLQLVGEPFMSSTTALDLRAFQFYPNPVNQIANISFENRRATTTQLTVVNAVGQVVQTQILNNLPIGQQRITLDFSDLEQGIYFLQIKQDNRLKAVRFVKH